LNAIRGQKNAKKGFDRSVDRPVECHFAFCLPQKWLKGVGWSKKLSKSKQKQIAKIAGIAKIEKPIASFVITALRG